MKTYEGYGYSGRWNDSAESLTELANRLDELGAPHGTITKLVNHAAGMPCNCKCCTATRRPSLWRRFLDLLNWLVPYSWETPNIYRDAWKFITGHRGAK